MPSSYPCRRTLASPERDPLSSFVDERLAFGSRGTRSFRFTSSRLNSRGEQRNEGRVPSTHCALLGLGLLRVGVDLRVQLVARLVLAEPIAIEVVIQRLVLRFEVRLRR